MHQFYPTICFPGDECAEAIESPRDEEWAERNAARAAKKQQNLATVSIIY